MLVLFRRFVDRDGGPLAIQVLTLATILNIVGLMVNGCGIIITAGRISRVLTGHTRLQHRSRILLGTVCA